MSKVKVIGGGKAAARRVGQRGCTFLVILHYQFHQPQLTDNDAPFLPSYETDAKVHCVPKITRNY